MQCSLKLIMNVPEIKLLILLLYVIKVLYYCRVEGALITFGFIFCSVT